MPGVRRTAAFVAAFLLLSIAWATAESPQQHMLRAGTAVVFVTDAPLDSGRREGDVVAIHLRDELVLDGAAVAQPGTKAQLVVGGTTGSDGHRHPSISIIHFMVTGGLLPVRPVEPIVPPIPGGATIQATTLAEVDRIGDRWSIRIPFPFQLSGEQPASAYTPTPARTAPPTSLMRPSRRRPGSPTPAPLATLVPATPAPVDPSAASPSPSPGATKIPGR